ncbi:MAG: winged helix DNA-binding domain-containing protein, partial [Anaerolineae bacterium]|nr:winged helix DNA-binding domain-containing protein [Anaerolineae bacterium]
ALLADGALVAVKAELHGGQTGTLFVHRDHIPAMQQAADGAITARRTTFLNPFDNLFWAKGRDEALWGFMQRLEAYKKEKDRIWGYYCLPILHGERLVGRFDPKLERKSGTLILRALVLEPGIAPDDTLVVDVAAAMRDFLAWHGATDLVIERSDPAGPDGFGARLLAALDLT